MTDEWQWHHDAKSQINSGDLDAAEKIYVAIGEQPTKGEMASSAINSLAFSIMIPQNRFVEARAWLKDSIDLETGWESWNSLENLALCEYKAGNNELAERYLQQVIDADDGPVKAAKSHLKKIQQGEFAKPIAKPNLEYNEEWVEFDISGPLDSAAGQRGFYLRLIKYMHDSNQVWDEENLKQSTGGCLTGFANGMLKGKLLELGLTRDAAAKACLDYFNYVQMGRDPASDPYVEGLDLWNAGEFRDALSKLREATRAGNVDAMLLVARGVEIEFDEDLAMPWYRLAAANGSLEAQEYFSEADYGTWDEGDGDVDDEEDVGDDEDPQNHGQAPLVTGAKFCVECGNARRFSAKYCTNCGTSLS